MNTISSQPISLTRIFFPRILHNTDIVDKYLISVAYSILVSTGQLFFFVQIKNLDDIYFPPEFWEITILLEIVQRRGKFTTCKENKMLILRTL